MIVDAHAHVIVPEVARTDWGPRVFREDGAQIVEFRGKRIRSAVREFVDADAIVAEQDAAGVDHVVLSPWVTLLGRETDLQNEALAALAAAHAGRVSALGTVPLADPERAARELEGLMRVPGLNGVEVPASLDGAYLGDDRFLPFWEAAEDVGALVFVHPTTRGFELPVFDDYYLWNSVGNPLETTVTAAQLVTAGVMERHPRLNVLLAHAGGAILALRGRLRRAYEVQPQARARLRASPDESLRRFLYDTVTHDVDLLREVVRFAGADRVLAGSDYPFDMGVERPAEIVRALGLAPDEERAILGGNALRVLRQEARA